jgi:hypothetical protein
VPPIQTTPDILHGSYRIFIRNLPLQRICAQFGHKTPTRPDRITKISLVVKRDFCISAKNIQIIFVQKVDCVFPYPQVAGFGLLGVFFARF